MARLRWDRRGWIVSGVAASRAARFAEVARQVGHHLGLVVATLIKNAYKATKVLGKAGGAYVGACVQAACRKVADAFWTLLRWNPGQ